MKRVLIALLLLSACREETAGLPDPVPMTAEAVGHYCQMGILEHPGPKAQVHLDGLPGMPLFFSQVRDAVTYMRLPEQSHAIKAVYVSDMGLAVSWEQPGTDNWINAAEAFYVVGSAQIGGMGAPELVPFASRPEAEAFAAKNGGHVQRLDEIEDADVLTPATLEGDTGAGDDGDYAERLRKLSHDLGG